MFQLQGWISEHEFGYTEVIRNPIHRNLNEVPKWS